MLLEIFYSIIGTWARAVIEWLQANPAITLSVLLLWIAIFFAGKYQLQRVERRTRAFVLKNAQQMLDENPQMNSAQLYEKLYPRWCQLLRKTAWFVPHRSELWPLPATPKIVNDRINFTPEWLHNYLKTNGINVHKGEATTQSKQ
jgi:hypothetical protein